MINDGWWLMGSKWSNGWPNVLSYLSFCRTQPFVLAARLFHQHKHSLSVWNEPSGWSMKTLKIPLSFMFEQYIYCSKMHTRWIAAYCCSKPIPLPKARAVLRCGELFSNFWGGHRGATGCVSAFSGCVSSISGRSSSCAWWGSTWQCYKIRSAGWIWGNILGNIGC